MGFFNIFRSREAPPKIPDPIVGINAHLLDPPALNAIHHIGTRSVRLSVYWSGTEWDREDEIVGGLSMGLDLLVVIRGNPPMGEIRTLVLAYPEVGAWQVGNEVDVDGAASDKYDRPYAEVLREAYRTIKAANPKALVVTSGMAGDGFYSYQIPEDTYDVRALHAYGPPAWEVARWKRANLERWVNKPVWLTEFGFEAKQKPEADFPAYQFGEWRLVIERNARDRLFERVYGYVLHGDGHAIYTEDWTPLPTIAYLRSKLT